MGTYSFARRQAGRQVGRQEKTVRSNNEVNLSLAGMHEHHRTCCWSLCLLTALQPWLLFCLRIPNRNINIRPAKVRRRQSGTNVAQASIKLRSNPHAHNRYNKEERISGSKQKEPWTHITDTNRRKEPAAKAEKNEHTDTIRSKDGKSRQRHQHKRHNMGKRARDMGTHNKHNWLLYPQAALVALPTGCTG